MNLNTLTDTHIGTYMKANKHMHSQAQKYKDEYIKVIMDTDIYTHVCKNAHTFKKILIYIHTYTLIPKMKHTNINNYTHTQTQTHTDLQMETVTYTC